MKKLIIFNILTLVFISLFAAEDKDTLDLMEMSLEELMDVEISVASNVVSAKKHQPASVTVVSHKQLELSGARTLSEALSIFVPGYFLVEDQDDVIAGFRGLAPDNNSKVLLLVNGQNMNTEWFWGPPQAILDSINFDWIDRVEVIRGPGSVTLGQGALLGVINIITKKGVDLKDDTIVSNASVKYGLDSFRHGGVQTRFKKGDLTGFFNVSASAYAGQEFRNEGYAKERKHSGRIGDFGEKSVYEAGHKLKRSDNVTAVGNLEYKGLRMNFLFADQTKDLYNFYRDREITRERLISLALGYDYIINNQFSLHFDLNGVRDDFALSSVYGISTGGTREDRFGFKTLFKVKEVVVGNNFAAGFEIRLYQDGKKNLHGANYIINKLSEDALSAMPSANSQKTMGYDDTIPVISFFLEDFQNFNEFMTVFGAARLDIHKYWGTNITPRIGLLVSPMEDLGVRLSYQSGFRGAVGVHYSGGYKGDGYLREENFDKVENYNIPGAKNIAETKPETMHSLELAVDYDPLEKLHVNLVTYFNVINNILDVGTISQDPDDFYVPDIGTDMRGDWNGYWFYKNAQGSLKQAGAELTISYIDKMISAHLSHAFVMLVDAGEPDNVIQSNGSMYIAHNAKHFKAFPENVTRLNVLYSPLEKIILSLNALYYYRWQAPLADPTSGTKRGNTKYYVDNKSVTGNFILNLGASYEVLKGLKLSLIAKNLLNQQNLYPMNANGGEESPGTPAQESITVWGGLDYTF